MNRKMSSIVYINILAIFFFMVFHERIEQINHWLIYVILVVYAVIIGGYIQKVVNNEKRLEKEVQSERRLANLAMSSVPSSVIIISPEGFIEYVNQSTEKMLGSKETVGLNILTFDTIISSPIFEVINKAIIGISSRLEGVGYTSFTSREEKILNVLALPLEEIQDTGKYRIMLFMTDITYEHYLTKTVEKQYLNMFQSFAKFIDAKDVYTGYHSTNVTHYVEKIIDCIDLDKGEAKEILIAANLHDIGKVGIREEVLNKPGKLTEEEYGHIKNHPEIGFELLSEIEGYELISKIIKYHHERWNGMGYPDGLKGDEIPLGAQIISIADAYDAIVSDRIYRKGRSKETAIQILLEEKDKQFNGRLVDIFIESIKDL